MMDQFVAIFPLGRIAADITSLVSITETFRASRLLSTFHQENFRVHHWVGLRLSYILDQVSSVNSCQAFL
jgi:hypothetical protein